MTCKIIPFAGKVGLCDRCGKTLVGRQKRWCSKKCCDQYSFEHHWSSARAVAKRRDKYMCTKRGCNVKVGLEVNHIKPRNGKGYGFGCWNHLSNLETLCHAHHVGVTNQQRAARKKKAVRIAR